MTEVDREIGTAVRSGWESVPRAEAEQALSDGLADDVVIPPSARASRGPNTCPACGSSRIRWASTVPDFVESDADPLLHDGQGLADVFVCDDCDARWIEPEHAGVVTWVRPYRRAVSM
jgi:hypothetical protein